MPPVNRKLINTAFWVYLFDLRLIESKRIRIKKPDTKFDGNFSAHNAEGLKD